MAALVDSSAALLSAPATPAATYVHPQLASIFVLRRDGSEGAPFPMHNNSVVFGRYAFVAVVGQTERD